MQSTLGSVARKGSANGEAGRAAERRGESYALPGLVTEIPARHNARRLARRVPGPPADDQGAIGRLARLAVPAFADCCMVDLEAHARGPGGRSVWADPARDTIVDILGRRPAKRARVRACGARLFAAIPERFWESIAVDAEHLRALRGLAFRSLVVVPLVAREQVLGTIHFLTGESRRRYCSDDLPRAEALAHATALAVDNARLDQHARATATAAEAASRAKDEALAMLSHEMRSPLAAITLWAGLLRMGKVPQDSTAQAIAAIERNAAILSRFSDELLDASRIVSGKLALDLRTVDLAAVAAAAVDTVRNAVDAKGLRLETLIDSSGRVAGDPTRLQQVISNLLTNAVKFSKPGGRVLLRVAAKGSHAVISVRDAGEGIAPALLPHVFERFRQVHDTSARVHGGLGLGLALVRDIVALHHGTVNAESPGPGQGATFSVTLPFMECP